MFEGLQAIRKEISSAKMENVDKDEIKDGYQLRFIGKNYAKFITGLPTDTLLVPDTEWNNQTENKDSQNIFITGDNLPALKHLVNAYAGQIKMIYTDPLYNTGSDDFVYRDSFNFTDEELQQKLELSEKEISRIRALDGKCSHSAWLTFMLPRLRLAKQLLAKDGVIFISIDDNEQANLKLLCDEIFGESNRLGIICWECRNPNMDLISADHEYCLVYAKDKNQISANYIKSHKAPFSWYGRKINRKYDDSEQRYLAKATVTPRKAHYTYYIVPGVGENPTQGAQVIECSYEDIDNLDKTKYVGHKYYAEAPNTARKNLLQNKYKLEKIKNEWSIKEIIKKEEDTHSAALVSVIHRTDIKYDDANKDLREIDFEIFNYAKPVQYIKDFIKAVLPKDFIVLDFFAGSATTAHAVMALNKEDGGNRQYIMVQLPEPTYTIDKNGQEKAKKGSEDAYNAGFRTIDQISRERIKRAAKQLGDKSGFKHYKLANVANEKILEKIDTFDPNKQLVGFDDMLTSFSGEALNSGLKATGVETLLTTWLVDDGFSLTTPIIPVKLGQYTAYAPADSKLLYLLNTGWNSENTKELLNKIGKGELVVQRLIIYNHSFDFVALTELKTNLNSILDNDKKVELIERF